MWIRILVIFILWYFTGTIGSTENGDHIFHILKYWYILWSVINLGFHIECLISISFKAQELVVKKYMIMKFIIERIWVEVFCPWLDMGIKNWYIDSLYIRYHKDDIYLTVNVFLVPMDEFSKLVSIFSIYPRVTNLNAPFMNSYVLCVKCFGKRWSLILKKVLSGTSSLLLIISIFGGSIWGNYPLDSNNIFFKLILIKV